MRRVLIHIGPHRTGTTSLQRFLADSRTHLLPDAGWKYPQGLVWDDSHVELTVATLASNRLPEIRPFVDFAIERLQPGLPSVVDAEWPKIVIEAVERDAGHDCIYSDENLSWLRSTEEMESLLDLFPDSEVSIVAVQRDPQQFLASYEWMARFTALSFSEDPESIWYVDADSWLAHLAERTDRWRRVLGDDRVHVVDYEACMADEGSILPDLCAVIGLGREVGRAAAAEYHDNERPA